MSSISFYILYFEELKFNAEREKLSEKGIEVWFGAKVKDLMVVRMVYVSKYSEKLTVDVLCGRRETLGEFSAYRRFRGRKKVRIRRHTCFRREHILIIEHILNPSHNVVDISRRGQLDLFSILVDPSVIKPDSRYD